MSDKNLDARIREAFADDAKATTIGTLIDEVSEAAKQAEQEAEGARQVALDPTLKPAEIEAARKQMADAEFSRDRMLAAAEKLKAQLKIAKVRETNERRKVAYEAALAERDRVAAEVAERWPALEDQLVALLAQLAAVDARVEAANRDLPDGAARLLSAEAVARGLKGFASKGREVLSLVRATKLPAFRDNPMHAWAWPRPAERRKVQAPQTMLAEIVVPRPFTYQDKSTKRTVFAGRQTTTPAIAKAAVAAGLAVRPDDPDAERLIAELQAAGGDGLIPHPKAQEHDIAAGKIAPARLELAADKAKVAA